MSEAGNVREELRLQYRFLDLRRPKLLNNLKFRHRLTKLIKSDPVLREIPVIIFSSLVTEEMRVKGKELGADEQLSKPEIGHLVDVMDGLLDKKKQAR